jgi:stage II sporulation protein AA (anti-sigma F factor antagonist)
MEITHRVENEILIFAINGRLHAATAPIAEETIKRTLEENTHRLLFDLSALGYLSSGGLRVILAASKEIRRREGKVALAA